jgi:glucokinase
LSRPLHTFKTKDHKTLEDAIEHYFNLPNLRGFPRPVQAALAVAGPVSSDVVELTNKEWKFSSKQLQEALNIQATFFNDFEAVARAMPELRHPRDEAGQQTEDLLKIGGGQRVLRAPIAVIGPGTGLGVAGLVPNGHDWIAIPGEGGHATMTTVSAEESRILDLLRIRWNHISAERVLSGHGLVNLYRSLCMLHVPAAANFTTPEEITEMGLPSSEKVQPDWLCFRAFETFCAMLGTIAGNVALTFGAVGGVYIAGGILPRFPQHFAESPFRSRFEEKARLRHYLEAIPTYLVLDPAPALVGLIELIHPKLHKESLS